MTTTITINEGSPAVIELEPLTPPPIVDVIQLVPARVNIIGTPGGPGPTGPEGPEGPIGPQGPEGAPGVDLDSTTKQIILSIPGGYGPSVNPAVQEPVTSSGTPPANAPPVTYYQLAFDPGTDQHWFYSFTLPADYLSGGSVRLKWATKGSNVSPVVWKAATAIEVVGTTDADAAVFDTVVTASGVPSTTQGITTETTLNLTMANAAANRRIIMMIGRDADNSSDTNPNVAVLLSAMFDCERA